MKLPCDYDYIQVWWPQLAEVSALGWGSLGTVMAIVTYIYVNVALVGSMCMESIKVQETSATKLLTMHSGTVNYVNAMHKEGDGSTIDSRGAPMTLTSCSVPNYWLVIIGHIYS